MPIQTSCPGCGRPLRVPDDLIGQQVQCPGCEIMFAATASASPPADADTHEEPAPSPHERVRERLPIPPRRPFDDRDDDEFDDVPPLRRRDYRPHRGTLILVLGIISFFVMINVGLGFSLSIPAWVMGSADLKLIRAGVMDPAGESTTNAGRILGIVVTILNVLVCVGCGGYIALAIANDW